MVPIMLAMSTLLDLVDCVFIVEDAIIKDYGENVEKGYLLSFTILMFKVQSLEWQSENKTMFLNSNFSLF